jgi:hypothetical protein
MSSPGQKILFFAPLKNLGMEMKTVIAIAIVLMFAASSLLPLPRASSVNGTDLNQNSNKPDKHNLAAFCSGYLSLVPIESTIAGKYEKLNDMVFPYGWIINQNGAIRHGNEDKMGLYWKNVDFLRANEVKVVPMIVADPRRQVGFYDSFYENITKNREVLLNFTTNPRFDGLNLDFEPGADYNGFVKHKQDYVDLVGFLAHQMKENGKTLVVSLYFNGAYDALNITKKANYIVDMLYPGESLDAWELMNGPSGPAESTPATLEEKINQRKELLGEKMFNKKYIAGLGIYGVIFKYNLLESKWTFFKYSTREDILKITQKSNCAVLRKYWDKNALENCTEYAIIEYSAPLNTGLYKAYYADAKSFEYRIEKINELGVKKIALWKFGGEDTTIGELLTDFAREKRQYNDADHAPDENFNDSE